MRVIHQTLCFATGLLLAGGLPILLIGCEGQNKPLVKTTRKQQEVEVAPGKWVTIEREDEEIQVDVGKHVSLNIPIGGDRDVTRLRISWQGQTVVWEGMPVPFCLREWEGKLFVIGLDRTDMKKCRFRYYRQDGNQFSEIQPAEFPKRIATQNMWLDAEQYSIGQDRRKIYRLQLARELNPEDIYFHRTLTAYVWRHLSTGEDYEECSARRDEATVRQFKDRYDPIALPTIIRTPAGWPNAQATSQKDLAE